MRTTSLLPVASATKLSIFAALLLGLTVHCGSDSKTCMDESGGNTHVRYSACLRACRIDKDNTMCGEPDKIALAACMDRSNPDRKQLCEYLCMDGDTPACLQAKSGGFLE